MHGRTSLLALALGAIVSLMGASSANAAFDVDGVREHSLSRPAAALKLRETMTANLLRLSGYGDQCTAYALDRMHEATGVWMAVTGNAHEWASQARSAGWRVGNRPAAKSILVMPPAPGYKYSIYEPITGLAYETPMHPLGHVAWVEEVDGDWVFIKDQNWRRGQIGERWVNVKDSPMRFIYSR
jgi:surface antigen